MKKEYSKQQQNTRNSGFIALLTGFRTLWDGRQIFVGILSGNSRPA